MLYWNRCIENMLRKFRSEFNVFCCLEVLERRIEKMNWNERNLLVNILRMSSLIDYKVRWTMELIFQNSCKTASKLRYHMHGDKNNDLIGYIYSENCLELVLLI